jgi:hypothetical protein
LTRNRHGRGEENKSSKFSFCGVRNPSVKTIKGWRRLSNEGGFLNETTGQTLIVVKKEFGTHYHVLLFAGQQTEPKEGKKISPDYDTEKKAEAFAIDWMMKNPNGDA